MHKAVANCSRLLPGHARVGIPDLRGEIYARFTDDLEVANHRILQHAICQERFLLLSGQEARYPIRRIHDVPQTQFVPLVHNGRASASTLSRM